MKKALFNLTLLCVSFLFLAACSKDSKPVVPAITVSESGLETVLLSDVTSGSISFESNTVWSAVSDQTWLSISGNPKGVSGKVTLKFNLEANEDYDDRTAKITVTAGDESTDGTVTKEFTIIQKQKNALTAGKTSFENLEYGGDTVEVEVLHNVDYTIKINDDWITAVEEPATKALVSTKLKFAIAENTTTSPRTGSIEFASGDLKETIQISQKGGLADDFKTASVEIGYMAQFYGVYPDLSIWNISILNEDAKNMNYDGKQQTIQLTITAPASHKFKDGVPEGEFILDPATFDSKPYTGSDAQLYTQDKETGTTYGDLKGKLIIKKVGDSYKFTTTVLNNGTESITSVITVKQGVNLKYEDGSCFSQLTSDITIKGTSASFVKLAKPYATNAAGGDVWKLVITGNGGQYKAADDTFSGTGDILQASIFTKVKGGVPTVEFNIEWLSRNVQYPVVDSYCNTGEGISDPHFDGTGYMNYSIADSKLVINKYAPSGSDKTGKLTITKTGDNYTISIQFYDDSVDEPHNVQGSYSGSATVVDQTAGN